MPNFQGVRRHRQDVGECGEDRERPTVPVDLPVCPPVALLALVEVEGGGAVTHHQLQTLLLPQLLPTHGWLLLYTCTLYSTPTSKMGNVLLYYNILIIIDLINNNLYEAFVRGILCKYNNLENANKCSVYLNRNVNHENRH